MPCSCAAVHLQVMAAAELRRRLQPGSRVAVFAADPGESTTGIMQVGCLRAAYQLLLPWILITPAEGAHLSCV